MASDLDVGRISNPSNIHVGQEPSMSGLVTGIVNDAQELIKQQLALARHEIKEDFRKTKEAALSLALGGTIALLGGILLCGMLVYLLDALTVLPLWACYGIVGGLLAVVGGVLVYLGKKKLDSFNPLPEESAQALKENVQWITKPR
jgi:hypothetical protein